MCGLQPDAFARSAIADPTPARPDGSGRGAILVGRDRPSRNAGRASPHENISRKRIGFEGDASEGQKCVDIVQVLDDLSDAKSAERRAEADNGCDRAVCEIVTPAPPRMMAPDSLGA